MSQKEEKVQLTRWQRIDRQCRAFANFFYNKQTREVMGRSKVSWAKIGLFYLVYYGFLAGFFSSCLVIFLTTINNPGEGGPKNMDFLQGDRSAPGLNLVQDMNKYQTDMSDKIKNVQKYLNGFEDPGYGSSCNQSVASSQSTPCKFEQSLLGDCSGLIPSNKFGFDTKKPCVFIKLNKIYGWVPKNGGSEYMKLSCQASGGSVEVKPEGYLIKAFPFKGEKFYQTPPVAVIVSSSGGDKVNVKCTLVADNIKVSETFVHSRAFGKIAFDVTP